MRSYRNCYRHLSIRVLACAVIGLAACGAAASAAEESDQRTLLLRAHAKRDAGHFLQAEQLYQQVLKTATTDSEQDIAVKSVCTEQLFDIYRRLGHEDKAILYGLEFRADLKKRGDQLRLRNVDFILGECYFALAHYAEADRYLQRANSYEGDRPINPTKKMRLLIRRAVIAERRGKLEEQRRHWIAAVKFGRRILDEHRDVLPLRDQIELSRNLAHALRVAGKPDEAIEQLQVLLERLTDHQYDRGRRELLAELATHYDSAGKLPEAEDALRRALKMYEGEGRSADMSRADLLGRLSAVLNRRDRSAEARTAADQAAQIYRRIISESAVKQHDSLESLNAFFRLKDLLRYTHQYRQAVELVSEQPWVWTEESLLSLRLSSERGALHAAEGSYEQARIYLRRALEYRRGQNPLNLSQLPRTINNLALVEQAMGNLKQANQLCQECLELYDRFGLPDDRDLAETYNLLATGAALEARYGQAVQLYRRGIEICGKLGPEADGHRGNLLLNLAKTYKSQGQYDAAIEQCEDALAIISASRGRDSESASIPAVYCALATMYVAQERFEEARSYAEKTLSACERLNLQDGPVVSTAQHCLAIVSLVDQDYQRAEELWQAVLSEQERTGRSALKARTYNYLGATAALQGHLKDAEQHYRSALNSLADDSNAYPVTRFVSLWKLARIRHLHGDEVESRDLLKQAVKIAEATRVETYGAEQHRADFFAQFAPAFDALFHLSLRDGDFAAALAYAERGRSRTFLDQLQLAGVDPRVGLKGTSHEPLLHQEAELKRKINLIRSKGQQLTAATTHDTKSLQTELQSAQREYAQLWHRILNASPHYRNLLVQNLSEWNDLQKSIVEPGTMMLYYYLGRSRGYLLLVGSSLEQPEVFMLDVPAGFRIPTAAGETRRVAGKGLNTRGLKRQRADVESESGSFETTKKPLPLTRQRADHLVSAYLQALMVDGVASVRGVQRRRTTDPSEKWNLKSTAMADVLLPARARKLILRARPQRLIVIPDGALHRLPLEALVLKSGPELRYVLDEMPPITYVPSAGVLAALQKQSKPRARGPATVLTLGDPAYPQGDQPATMHIAALRNSHEFLGLRGQVNRLPKTAEESRRVAKLFDDKYVTSLQGPQATEENLMAALSEQRYLHLAAHAFVDRQHGNLMGGILLTPPNQDSSVQDYDGVLSLSEIYTLPLGNCELAVLSACETNVGPHQTLEAGFSLARAFFKAGARRVVASHWTVEDESTSELVGEFFEEVSESLKATKPLDYAQALQTARLRVRNHPRWSHPFFWAPFVLIGPAMDRPNPEQLSSGRVSKASTN